MAGLQPYNASSRRKEYRMYVYSKARLVLTIAGLVLMMSAFGSSFVGSPEEIAHTWSQLGTWADQIIIAVAVIYCGYHLNRMYRADKDAVQFYRQIKHGLSGLRFDENGFVATRRVNGDMLYVRRSRILGGRLYDICRASAGNGSMTWEVYRLPAEGNGLVPRSVNVSKTAPAEGGGQMAVFDLPFRPFRSRGPRQLAFADTNDLREVAGWVDELAFEQMSKLK